MTQPFALESTLLALAWVLVGCVCAAVFFLAGQVWWATGCLAALLTLALLKEPNLAVYGVIFILYTNALPVAAEFHGVPKVVAAALPLVLALPLFSQLIGKRVPLFVSPVVPWIMAFLAIQSAGLLVAVRPDDSLIGVLTSLAEGLILFLLLTNLVRDPAVLRTAIWSAIAAGLLLALVGIYQHLTGSYENNMAGFAQVEEFDAELAGEGNQTPRLAGSIGEKNRFAHFMLMLLPLALSHAATERQPVLRAVALIGGLLIAIGAALSLSRGAAVGFAALLLAMGGTRSIKLRYLLALTAAGAAILLTLPQYSQRLDTVRELVEVAGGAGDIRQLDTAVVGRLTEMWAAARVFLSHPFIGVGVDMFPYHFLDHADELGVQVHNTNRRAHNLYLGLAAEHGMLGFCCFMVVVIYVYRRLRQTCARVHCVSAELASTAAAFSQVIVVYLAVGMFADLAYVRYFWLMIALACATIHIGDKVSARYSSAPSC